MLGRDYQHEKGPRGEKDTVNGNQFYVIEKQCINVYKEREGHKVRAEVVCQHTEGVTCPCQ